MRTLAPQRAFHSNFLFQFHKGAIRTLNFLDLRFSNLPYFNSIKVRLEHASDFVIPEMDSIFQFHKGAIRTHIDEKRQVL